MYINVIEYFTRKPGITCARCDNCFSIYAFTEDEILVFTNPKTSDIIRGFICPNCHAKLILNSEAFNVDNDEMEEEYDGYDEDY